MKCPLGAGEVAAHGRVPMSYPTPAVERAMKVQQVILKAISGNFSGGRPPRFSAFPLARCAAGNNVTSDTVTTGFSTAVVAAPVP